jgi:hypothetical protein
MTAERHYRRLLWAYPGHYRRRHGEEIVTTLLEMAEAGAGGPTGWQRLHLFACGLRQRFRLPAGRPLARLAALLAAVSLGAAGAAGGTWLGWQTATPLPSDGQLRTVTAATTAAGTQTWLEHSTTDNRGPEVGSWGTSAQLGSVGGVRAGLVAAGWQLTKFEQISDGIGVRGSGRLFDSVPAQIVQFQGVKGGLGLWGSATILPANAAHGIDQRTDQHLEVWAAEPAALRPLTVAGLLLGMLAGWLLTAAIATRARRSGRSARLTVVALAATVFAAATAPAFCLYCGAYQVLVYATGSPMPYYLATPADDVPVVPVVISAGIGLLALAGAAVVAARGARRGPDPATPEPAPLH